MSCCRAQSLEGTATAPFGLLERFKLRQSATLSALACGGHENQLRIHIGIARSLGFTRDELVELFMQLAPYAGFPVTINAVLAVKDIYPDT